jgi:photoactive yellow protein
MDVKTEPTFDDPEVVTFLDAADVGQLDALEFGVIGFDASTCVRVYNTWESRHAGLMQSIIIDQPMFTHVAQCMNNFMVAERFEQALVSGERLDETIDYVLTLRMRPTKVRLRMLCEPGMALRYLLVHRNVR